MKKRVLAMCMIMVLLLVGCGNSNANTANNQEETATNVEENVAETVEDAAEEVADELEAVADIEVEENLFDVELTLPADLVGETTQEELDAEAAELGYESVTLNEDGSVTYVMTKKQHEAMLEEAKTNFMAALDEMPGSESYPEMVSIDVNDDFTEFVVTTTNEEVSMAESFTTLAFYMFGGSYSTMAGTEVDNINVKFVNEASGEVISEVNSSEAGE